MNRSTARVILSGFALVGVLLATVSVLGQVNAFSAITDAIGVTSPPGSSNGSSTSSPSTDENSNDETSDSVVDTPTTAMRPMEKLRQLTQKLIHVFLRWKILLSRLQKMTMQQRQLSVK
jgi:hypothetical protein